MPKPAPLPLAGQVAAVSGAARGIGRAIALTLARQGAFVAINFRQNETLAQSLLQEISLLGGTGQIFQADVSRPEQVAAWFRELYSSQGHVDVLINNAGITRDSPFITMAARDWHAVLETDLQSAFYCSKAVARRMCAASLLTSARAPLFRHAYRKLTTAALSRLSSA